MPSVVDEDVETAERLGGLVDRSPDRRRIGAVGLDGERLAALALDRPDDLGGAIGRTLIGDGDIRTLSASANPIAAPIPRDAPVTRARLPASSLMVCPFCIDRCRNS